MGCDFCSDITGNNIGITYVSDTVAHTPVSPHKSWYRFQPTQNSVIASATCGGVDGNTITSVTVNNGNNLDIPGCTSLTLASGSGILYYTL